MPNRFVPAWCATVALLGCFIPSDNNLISLPTLYDSNRSNAFFANSTTTMMAQFNDAKPMLAAAWWLSFLVYAVPLSAGTILVLTLRGYVSERVQIWGATIWLALGIAWPMATNFIAMAAMAKIDLFRTGMAAFGASPVRFNSGDWLIALAAIALLLVASRTINYVETAAAPPTRE